ncbi:MAG: TAXI family TRAP transporter solute-binding subunit [Alphaproteobacteria bacterium]|nr:TAXI family TRAP transporter solute-binding subunit [Alphaproteobacteria bacterium]
MTTIRRGLLAVAAVALIGAAPAFAQPKTMTLGTASVGGTYFVYGGVMAKILTDKTGIQVSTQQTQGPNQNVILVDDKKIELGMTTMGVALQAWTGQGDWTKGKKFENIRALFPMYDTPLQCMAMKKSGITSFKQLDGKTVGVGPRAGTPGTYLPLIFEALNMKATIRNGQGADMGGQLGDGILDAFCFGAGLPIPIFSQLDNEKEVVFFTWTDAEMAAIRKKMPEFSESMIPKATYKQQAGDQKTIGLYNFAIAHKDMDEKTAYDITKAVMENNAAMVQGHEAAKETIAANANRNGFLTFHPGAARYFREKGVALNPATLPK